MGDIFLDGLSWDSLGLATPTAELTWALCTAPHLLSISGVAEAANSPKLEGWGAGVTDSSPSGVVFFSDEAESLLSSAVNIICIRPELS